MQIIWEFRNSETQIYFDRREEIQLPLFLAIDVVWDLINQPTLIGKPYSVSCTILMCMILMKRLSERHYLTHLTEIILLIVKL